MRLLAPICIATSAYCLSSDSGAYCIKPPLWNDESICHLDQHDATARIAAAQPRNASGSWDGPSHCLDDYCVFSNRHFADGITLLTTKDNADRLAAAAISTLPATDSTRFHVTEVPGKGLGLVANTTIRRGERIMEKLPTALVHRKLVEWTGDKEAAFRAFDAAVMKLPAPRRRAYMRQAVHSNRHKVSDILFTNSFMMDIGGPDGHHSGNYPEVARFNHDCRPKSASLTLIGYNIELTVLQCRFLY